MKSVPLNSPSRAPAKDLAIDAIGGKCLQDVLLNSTINDPKEAAGMATSSLGSVTAVGKVSDE